MYAQHSFIRNKKDKRIQLIMQTLRLLRSQSTWTSQVMTVVTSLPMMMNSQKSGVASVRLNKDLKMQTQI